VRGGERLAVAAECHDPSRSRPTAKVGRRRAVDSSFSGAPTEWRPSRRAPPPFPPSRAPRLSRVGRTAPLLRPRRLQRRAKRRSPLNAPTPKCPSFRRRGANTESDERRGREFWPSETAIFYAKLCCHLRFRLQVFRLRRFRSYSPSSSRPHIPVLVLREILSNPLL